MQILQSDKLETQLEMIRLEQQALWNRFSPDWKKWDDLLMSFFRPMGDEIIKNLNLRNKKLVLDVASGTGEPGLTIAKKMRKGRVFITDLSKDMLSIARKNALQRKIKNIKAFACDACKLPFHDNTFDAISCRFGFMYFPDLLLAAREMVRVLKPGGKIATSVWDVPEKNFWISVLMGVINKHINLPALSPGEPGIFRCSRDGYMSDIFSQAGLKDISIRKVTGKLDCKTADVYWDVMNDLIPDIVLALAQADVQLKEKIRTQVCHAINLKYPDGDININAASIIISGEK